MVTTARLWFTPPREIDRYLPEGPRVLPDTGNIIWVNIQTAPDAKAGSLHARSGTSSAPPHPLPSRPGFVFPTDRPGVVFGTKDTAFDREAAVAHLYLYTVDDRRLSVLAGGMTCSNGKVFADGGRTLFDIDTPRKVVTHYELDIETRTPTERGIALDLRHRADFPDGMVDAGDGTVIVAFYNPEYADAGRAERFRLHTGEVLDEWLTPGSPRVTCPLLFEEGGAVKLLLTTADEGMAPELRAKCPNAGCLFVADTGLSAVPPAEVVRL